MTNWFTNKQSYFCIYALLLVRNQNFNQYEYLHLSTDNLSLNKDSFLITCDFDIDKLIREVKSISKVAMTF